MRDFRFLCLGWLSLAMVCSGCGSGTELASVEGTVMMDGKPLAGASVTFINSSTRPSGARTDEKGFYRLLFSDSEKGAVPGKNIVPISTAQGPGETMDGKPVPANKETVQAKYNTETTLEINVEPNKKNIADFSTSTRKDQSLEQQSNAILCALQCSSDEP